MKPFVPFACLVLLSSLFWPRCAGAQAPPPTPDPLLAAVPSGAVAVVLVDARVDTESTKALQATQTPEQWAVLRAAFLLGLQRALSEGAPGLDVETDLLPVFTRRAALCWLPAAEGQKPQPLVLLETVGGTAGDAAFGRFVQAGLRTPLLVQVAEVARGTIWGVPRNNPRAFFTRSGTVILVGPTAAMLEAALRDRTAARGTLAAAAQTLAAMPEGVLRMATAPRPVVPGQRPPFGLPGVGALAASVRLSPEGAIFQGLGMTGGGANQGPWATVANMRPTFGESIAGVPDSVAAAVVVARPALFFHAMGVPIVDALAAGAVGPAPLRKLGPPLSPILTDVLGQEVALGVWPSEGSASWLAVFTSAHPDTFGQQVGRFVEAGQGLEGVTWAAEPLEDGMAWSLTLPVRDPARPVAVHFAVVGPRLLVANDRKALEAGAATLRGQLRSVADAPWFVVGEAVGPNPVVKAVGPIQPLGRLFSGVVARRAGLPPTYAGRLAEALLVGFRTGAAGFRVDNRGVHFVASLEIDYPKFAALGGNLPVVAGALVSSRATARGRENARAAQCMSNLKQLCLAAIMYAQDHGRLPPAEGWVEALMPYVKNRAVLRCPADATGHPCSYAFHRDLSEKPLAEIPNPGQAVLFYESTQAAPAPTGTGDDLPPAPRHPNGYAFGFADGHVTFRPAWPKP